MAPVPQALRICDCPASWAVWGSPCLSGPHGSWLESAGTRTEMLVTSTSEKPTVHPKAGQHLRHLAPPTPTCGKSQAGETISNGVEYSKQQGWREEMKTEGGLGARAALHTKSRHRSPVLYIPTRSIAYFYTINSREAVILTPMPHDCRVKQNQL